VVFVAAVSRLGRCWRWWQQLSGAGGGSARAVAGRAAASETALVLQDREAEILPRLIQVGRCLKNRNHFTIKIHQNISLCSRSQIFV